MKKKLILAFALLLTLSMLGGCKGNSTNSDNGVTQEFCLEEAGIAYTIPDEWVTSENVNILPTSFVSYNGDIYAKIEYSYASDENMEELNDTESTTPVEDLLVPFVAIIAVRDANIENKGVLDMLATYETCEELTPQDGFHFYFLRDYDTNLAHFSEEGADTYDMLQETLDDFKKTIETFQPNDVEPAASEGYGQYLNFISTTLQGDSITSTVFHEYDLTVVNFWASYCYPKINELATLQAFSEDLKATYPNVNFVQVVIDTPADEAQEIVLAAYAEAGVTFTGIMPDQNMAGWIMDNIEGLPTTVFVDSTGMPMDTKIEGIQEASVYMDTTKQLLESIPDKE